MKLLDYLYSITSLFSYSITFETKLVNDKKLKEVISARRNFFRGGGSEVHQGRACKGVPGGGAPRRRRKMKFTKAMKNLQFFQNFQENFAIFSNLFLKFNRIFGENLEKNIENLEICTCRRFGGRSPPTLANLWKSE